MAWLDVLPRHGVRAHLIEVADPAEETFPYAGRTEFSDPETGEKLTAGPRRNGSRRLSQRLSGAARSELASLLRAARLELIPSTTPTGSPPKRWSRVHCRAVGRRRLRRGGCAHELAAASASASLRSCGACSRCR